MGLGEGLCLGGGFLGGRRELGCICVWPWVRGPRSPPQPSRLQGRGEGSQRAGGLACWDGGG